MWETWVRFLGREDPLEKEMATHSSTLAWKIPWTEEPDRLQSMGSLRIGHDWANSLPFFTLMHWRRKWQPTPVFLPGESQGRRSLVGYSSWGHKELDTTELLHTHRRREKERVWENFWRDYSWKFPQHGKENSQSNLRGTKSPIQDKIKEKHAKIHTNKTNKD